MIRRAFVEDIPAIQAVARIAWEDTYQDIMRPQTRSQFLEEFYSTDALAKAISLSVGGIWVAERDRSVVGFLQVVAMLDKPGLELSRLYVLPERQRQGVGQDLLRFVLSQYPKQPFWALVEKDDKSAMGFYGKNAFQKKRELILNLYGEDLCFVEFYSANKEGV
jgi:ribosomal protein S18 acetylase RimI-like enzyme